MTDITQAAREEELFLDANKYIKAFKAEQIKSYQDIKEEIMTYSYNGDKTLTQAKLDIIKSTENRLFQDFDCDYDIDELNDTHLDIIREQQHEIIELLEEELEKILL